MTREMVFRDYFFKNIDAHSVKENTRYYRLVAILRSLLKA